MNNTKCRFCGKTMKQVNNRQICPHCSATARDENDQIIWTFPEKKGMKADSPVWDCFNQYSIDEMKHLVAIGEAKIGERNTFARNMLNKALQAKGSEPLF